MPVHVSARRAEKEIAMQGLDRRSTARSPEGLATDAAGQGAPHRRGARPVTPPRWLALALLASAQLMLVLDITVVTVALPDIGTALHLHPGELPWVMTGYTLVFGGLMLLGGRIADLFGARRLTLIGLAVFTASSLLCALSQDGVMLLAGRSLQGLGAALMSPAALATVMTLFPGPGRGKALGVWAALAGAGSALGVILGGVLTSEAGWRWVFAINVPIGVALLIAIPLAVPAQRPGATERGLDIPGAALVTAGTAAAIYGLINVGSHGWAATSTVLPLALAVAAWAAFAMVERRARRPLLSVGLLGQRAALAGSLLMLAATGLMVGGFFLGSFALQRAHHFSALHVGLAFLPIAVATVIGAQAGTQLLTRVNTRIVAVTGLALAAGGYAVAAHWPQPAAMVTGLSIAALGIGATFVTAFTASLADAAPTEAGLRSALVNTFHELGGAAGVAVLSSTAGAALVAARLASHDFTRAFTVGAVIGVVAVATAAVLVPAVLQKPPAAGPPADRDTPTAAASPS
jgi:EmrB/QacA subfamily drug resistance transporter